MFKNHLFSIIILVIIVIIFIYFYVRHNKLLDILHTIQNNVDKNTKSIKEYQSNYNVFSPSIVTDRPSDTISVVTSNYDDELAEELKELEINRRLETITEVYEQTTEPVIEKSINNDIKKNVTTNNDDVTTSNDVTTNNHDVTNNDDVTSDVTGDVSKKLVDQIQESIPNIVGKTMTIVIEKCVSNVEKMINNQDSEPKIIELDEINQDSEPKIVELDEINQDSEPKILELDE
jgi:hypothetical protein